MSIRPLIESYALLSIPLAAFIQWSIFNKNRFFKILFLCLITVFNLFGIYHTLKYHYGSLHYSDMTKEAYWQSFGKLRADGNFDDLLQKPDYEKARQGEDE